MPSGIKRVEATEKLYDETLKNAGMEREYISKVVAAGSSGVGDRGLPFDTQIAGAIGAAFFTDAMLERVRAKSVTKA